VGEVVKLRQQWAIDKGNDARVLNLGWEDDGEWYNGKVTNIFANKFKVLVYTCTFETPDRHKIDLNYAETKKMVKAYQELNAYRKKKEEADAAANVTSDSFDGDDASSPERHEKTNLPQDDAEIMPKIEGYTSNLPSKIPPKVKTIEEMAREVEMLQRQVPNLTRQYAPPTRAIKAEYPTSGHVKTEANATDGLIDLVSSSSEDTSEDGSGTDTSRPPPFGHFTSTIPNALLHSRVEEREVPVRIKTQRTTLRTPSYTKGKQRRDCSSKNWQSGVRRNASEKRINEDIMESTAENLPQILKNMRVSGFGIIRNFKKLTHRTKLPLHVNSSDDEECASTPRTTSVFVRHQTPPASGHGSKSSGRKFRKCTEKHMKSSLKTHETKK
jgi:hypothetical protein